jgi:hypothetical protein
MSWSPHGRKTPKNEPTISYFLDSFSVRDIRLWAQKKDKFLKYHWDFYSNLAYQRSKIADDLKKAVLEAAEEKFPFEHWQRVIKYKYALRPLSGEGSLIDPGGRFNIGDINPDQYPPFPALYIAEDKDTGLQEVLSQKINPKNEQKALDYALTNPASIASISLSGSLDRIINLTKPSRLEKFIRLIKDFTIPPHLLKAVKELKISRPELIRTMPKFLEAILNPDWRVSPMTVDVPAPSQIFGQLVFSSGIEGILYPSKFNDKLCLAIFPQNFEGTDSYLQLDDGAPAELKIRKLDATNLSQMHWKQTNF